MAENEADAAPLAASQAAVMIQKTYRGYRARRKIADAAIMARKYGWWNIVEAVVLQHHTQDFYAHSKSWKSSDHWARLKRKASKVGKGLSKDSKALKLALQHWLEAVDARHRYGHNLSPYYHHWLGSNTPEPFFYWLDIGGGREVELEQCSRSKLQKQQIKFVDEVSGYAQIRGSMDHDVSQVFVARKPDASKIDQRRHYEVEIYKGKLYYKVSGELVNTPKSDRWIFVMSPYGRLYVAKKEKGVFQHSSFLAGGATTAAGRLKVKHGVLELMEAHSGHYRPSPENFEALVRVLIESGADLTLAQVQLVSDDFLEKGSLDGNKGEELAEEVKTAIEETCADEGFAVRIENQHLIAVDSVAEGALDCLVTNLTFQQKEVHLAESAPAEHKADAKEDEAKAGKETIKATEPGANDASRHKITESELDDSQRKVRRKTAGGKEANEEIDVAPQKEHRSPPQLPIPTVGFSPQVDHLFQDKSTVPGLVSPGFSRVSSLMGLSSTERRKALEEYGPGAQAATPAF